MPEKPPVFDQVDRRIEDEEEFSSEQKTEFKKFFREYYEEISFETRDVRLDRLFADNVRTIDKADAKFKRSDTILYGQNSKGKTSLIKALLYNIAGLPENPTSFDMTRLINNSKSSLNTVGYWTIDDSPYTLERSLRQSGQGSSLSDDQEAYLSKNHTTEASISGKFTDPSDVLTTFGLQELKQRGHDPYEILSLFFLMSEDFTRFLGGSHSELMDLLFGVNITTVISAIENKIDELELSDAENRSIQKIRRFEPEKEDIQSKIIDTKRKQDSKLNELKEKEDKLKSLEDTLSGQNQLDKLRRRKNELEGRKADYKVEKSEIVEKIASVRRTIERYEDTELTDDMSGIADELRNFMTVPNRCPICTNEVDTEQREALVNDGDCPLCMKEMPSSRRRTELEYEQSNHANDTDGSRHEDSLDNLRKEKRELEGEKDQIEAQIESVNRDIEQLSKEINQNDLSGLADERDKLQKEVRSLRDDTVELNVKIDSLNERLNDVNYEIKANKHLKLIGQHKDNRRQAYRRFKSIAEKSRSKQRKSVKQQIGEEMRRLFKYFNNGTLEDAHDIQFKSGGSYHFVIQTPQRNLDSSVADESTAEINLHALLFHTAVLKRLSKSITSFPLRLFIVDSPFANEVDEQNTKDIENFLINLPQILPEYQVIVASAETDSFEPSEYSSSYNLVHFD